MDIRRPMAAALTALAILGGSASLASCSDPTGTGHNDGTTDGTGDQSGGAGATSNHGDAGDNDQTEDGDAVPGG